MPESHIPSFSLMTRDSGAVVVQMQGDLDAYGTREIEPALAVALSNRTQHIILDLSNVGFLVSAGLALLASHALALRRGGGSVSVAGAKGIVAEVIQQSGFGEILPNYPTLDEAILAVEKSLRKRDRDAPAIDVS